MTARLIYAASETCADLWYASGFSAPDPFLWYQTDRETAVVVSQLELGRARKQTRPGTAVHDADKLRDDLGLPAESDADKKRPHAVRLITAIAEHTGVAEWTVPEDFPLGLARQLEAAGLRLATTDSFAPERAVKSAAEIEHIRHSERLAEAGLAAAEELLRRAAIAPDGLLLLDGAPLTAEMLIGAIDAEIARQGGCAQGTIAAPGIQSADPHQSGHGPIRAGEPIVMDIFPRDPRTGYYGDLTRTRVKGRAPEIVQKAYQAVLEIQQRMLDSLRPGVLGKDLQQQTTDFFTEAGFPTGRDETSGSYHGFFHGLGHSVGLEIHEKPSLNKRGEAPLAAGNVVTVEPGVYYPEWGGIRIEDTVAITPDGIDNLATAPKFLEIP